MSSLLDTISKVCHEANRAVCLAAGQTPLPSWEDAPETARDATRQGVIYCVYNRNVPPAQVHQDWYDNLINDGWVYGSEKDYDKKTHPCLIPYESLPYVDRLKDGLFKEISITLFDGLQEEADKGME